MDRIHPKIRKMNDENGTVLSLYQSTPYEASAPGSNAIRFKNLIREAEEKLSKHLDRKALKEQMEILQDLQKDTVFWNDRSEAFALFLRDGELLIYNLSEPVEDMVVVQGILHLLPLLAAEQHISTHYILDISKDRFNLYRGDGSNLTEIEDHGLLSFNELFPDFDADSNVNFGSYGGIGGSAFHGHRSPAEMKEIDKIKYYRYLEENLTPFFKKKGHHVILAGVRDNMADWRSVASNELYLNEDLGKPLHDFDSESLRNAVLAIFEHLRDEKIQQGMDSLAKGLADGKASTRLDDIKKAAEECKIETLYIRSDYHDEEREEYDHLVRDCFQMGGNVVMVPTSVKEMEKRIAARFRY
ncbi:MAG: hypothetical protein PHR78_01520 [Eubacteriales bacterium]|nr:hypothetical protein [Eubacteriales bacterium]MDD4540835.1 hypothetical protein [Eubacteriales bacterium]